MLTWVLLTGVALLLANALVGENGYLETLRLRRTETSLMHAVANMRLENQRLKDDRARLDSDPDAIEQAIREQLGYIHPGEVTVIVHDTPPLEPDPAQ